MIVLVTTFARQEYVNVEIDTAFPGRRNELKLRYSCNCVLVHYPRYSNQFSNIFCVAFHGSRPRELHPGVANVVEANVTHRG